MPIFLLTLRAILTDSLVSLTLPQDFTFHLDLGCTSCRTEHPNVVSVQRVKNKEKGEKDCSLRCTGCGKINNLSKVLSGYPYCVINVCLYSTFSYKRIVLFSRRAPRISFSRVALGDHVATYHATETPEYTEIIRCDARGVDVLGWKIGEEHLIAHTIRGTEYTVVVDDEGDWAGEMPPSFDEAIFLQGPPWTIAYAKGGTEV